MAAASPTTETIFRKNAAVSFHERRPHAAFSFSKHEGLAQHCCPAQKPAIDIPLPKERYKPSLCCNRCFFDEAF
jgi:hypothetical protein